MSGYDIFAWIVLVILLASAIGGVLYRRLAARPYREVAQPSLCAGSDVAGWITLFFGFALWPVALIWAYVDVPARARREMRDGVALFNAYLVLLFLLVIRVVRFNLFWKASPAIVLVLLLFGLLIPMGWGAPQGNALVVRNAVSIVPDVAGEVTEVPVAANAPLRAGDVLFRIDPTPYEAQVKAIEAQFKLARRASPDDAALRARRRPRLRRRAAAIRGRSAQGQLEAAQWNLDKTVVRAPADGYVTNLALRKGARVANLPLAPVMAFIDTSDTIIGVEINQNDARYVAPGQEVEVTFKFVPGQIYRRQGRERAAGDRDRAGADLGHGRHAEGDRGGALRRARQARRRRLRADGCRPAAPARRRSTPITSSRPTSSAG